MTPSETLYDLHARLLDDQPTARPLGMLQTALVSLLMPGSSHEPPPPAAVASLSADSAHPLPSAVPDGTGAGRSETPDRRPLSVGARQASRSVLAARSPPQINTTALHPPDGGGDRLATAAATATLRTALGTAAGHGETRPAPSALPTAAEVRHDPTRSVGGGACRLTQAQARANLRLCARSCSRRCRCGRPWGPTCRAGTIPMYAAGPACVASVCERHGSRPPTAPAASVGNGRTRRKRCWTTAARARPWARSGPRRCRCRATLASRTCTAASPRSPTFGSGCGGRSRTARSRRGRSSSRARWRSSTTTTTLRRTCAVSSGPCTLQWRPSSASSSSTYAAPGDRTDRWRPARNSRGARAAICLGKGARSRRR